METYLQIHDFTMNGAGKFANFIAEYVKPGLDAGMQKLECLGVMEENLNSQNADPLTWKLSATNATDGCAHTFAIELDDLIIEHVAPDE